MLAIQNAAKIFDRIRLLAPLVLANLDPFRDHRVVYVAYDGAIDLGIEEEAFQVTATHPSGTDQPKPDLFAGRRFTRARRTEKRKTEASGSQWSDGCG